MSTHKHFDKICVSIVAVTLVLALLFCNGKAFGIETNARTLGYENRLFDNSKVHTIEIVIDDWDEFLETCESEVYSVCNVVIDGELIKKVGIRGKGNTSLSSVKNMNSSRYSFKIEFDQYDKTKSYYGLDKLCLNNIIQDNTYMKDYLAYTLMGEFGVDAPLCSFVYITVNGEDWGLYLAVEAIEDSFLERNYGNDYGELYKPDSMSFGGGGPGNGKDFSMTDFINENFSTEDSDEASDDEDSDDEGSTSSSGNSWSDMFPSVGGNFDPSNIPNMDFGDIDMSTRGGFAGGFGGFGGGGFGMGSDDVKLKYIDDDPDSYSNIFNNAKTTVNKADKNRLVSSLKALSEQSDIENTVDVDEVIRYFVVHNFLCNGDSYTGSMIHNYYLYEKDGQLSMIPWDYNLAYGSFSGGNTSSSVNAAIDTPVSGDMSDRPMISWIFDIEEYTEMYHEYFQEFLNSVNLTQMIEDTAALIDEYVQKDPTKFCTYEEYLTGVEAIKKFCELRAEGVQGQLNGTIPSTSSGQSAESSSLIDTTGLNTSDMGSMGSGGGFGGGNKGGFGGNMPEGFDPSQFGGNGQGSFGGNMPEDFDPSQFGGNGQGNNSSERPSTDKSTDEQATSDSAEASNTESGRPSSGKTGSDRSSSDKSGFDMGSFSGFSGSSSNNDATQYILLGVSAAILLVGVLVAALFKRRK
ncbi:MAG: CotH kinase family protein [Lachnospiraceae bacterium]|nr:CotH kinase family protein [Lachnospiraceae bacterium]